MDDTERAEKRQAAKWAAEKRAGFARIFRRLDARAERRASAVGVGGSELKKAPNPKAGGQ